MTIAGPVLLLETTYGDDSSAARVGQSSRDEFLFASSPWSATRGAFVLRLALAAIVLVLATLLLRAVL